MKTLCIMLLSLLLAMPAWAVVAPKPRAASHIAIVILPFDSALPKPFEALKAGMPDLVTACFTAYDGAAEILDRSALENISAEKTFTLEPGDYKRLKGATHVLRGSLAPQGNGFIANFMLYDAATAQLTASATVTGQSGGAAEAACDGVKQLAGKLGALTAAGSTGNPVSSEQALQSRFMIEGLGHYYNGDYDKAFPAFMKALKADPTNAAAQYWLARSYHEAGMEDQAHIEFRHFLEKFPKDARAAEVQKILTPAVDKPTDGR
jgi:tetratricopeptide (TPR) repeat protein